MQVPASFVNSTTPSPVSVVRKATRTRTLCTAEETEQAPVKKTRTLFDHGFYQHFTMKNGTVLRVDKSVEPNANFTVSLKAKLSCHRCHFTTSHGPALASHLTTHRILGIDLVDEGQHRHARMRPIGRSGQILTCLYGGSVRHSHNGMEWHGKEYAVRFHLRK